VTVRSFEQLTRIVPPPAGQSSDTSWDAVERSSTVRFSPSFRKLVETYGEGVIGNELELFDPRLGDRYWNRVSSRLAALREDFHSSEAPPPLPGFPANGPSLLTVAHNGNGDQIFLVVEAGLASDDSVWIGNRRNLEWLQVQGPLWSVLLDLVTSGPSFDAITHVFSDPVWRLSPTFQAGLQT